MDKTSYKCIICHALNFTYKMFIWQPSFPFLIDESDLLSGSHATLTKPRMRMRVFYVHSAMCGHRTPVTQGISLLREQIKTFVSHLLFFFKGFILWHSLTRFQTCTSILIISRLNRNTNTQSLPNIC